ncbi:MAG: CoA transferase [Hyphomicrobiales bacterium]|nr:MAG: CoA transferase [Hyphomicrobiales bacterium]
MSGQPLEGYVVVDFTTLLPGPLATLMLAEAGAEVIKVEKPGGEDMRRYPPRWSTDSAPFALLNRGKRSVELDLKAADAVERLRPLLERADVLVEQFRPGVMERLGLGYEAVKAMNPRIVYCSITGYGQSGPRANEAGHDLNYVGSTGLLAMAHGPIDKPVVPPALIADIGGGTFPAVSNILMALLGREKSGVGTYLDIAMVDTNFTFSLYAQAQGTGTGTFPLPGDWLLTGGSPRYQLYPTSDERLVAVAAIEDRFWTVLCAAIDLAEEFRDDSRDRFATRDAIAAIIRAKPASHWAPVFKQADCCVTIVESLEAAMQDPHFRGRGLFDYTVTDAAGETLPAAVVPVAPQFRSAETDGAVPPLGADNDRFLA